MLSIDIAIAKTHKYASRDSGDTAETVERPTGGLSVVLVDGQGSGAGARTLSMMVSSKAVSLLKEGIRDGAVARGAHDFLHAYRHGRVSATLDIVSVDLATSSLVVTRNSGAPYAVRQNGSFDLRETESGPIGLYRHTRPSIEQFALVEGLTVVVFSDGIVHAGMRRQQPFDPLAYLSASVPKMTTAHEIADGVLAAAMDVDQGRPNDDMTVVAVTIVPIDQQQAVRTFRTSLPFPG
jgi:serine phosphatase RsbU (regulator of sigma subunit)